MDEEWKPECCRKFRLEKYCLFIDIYCAYIIAMFPVHNMQNSHEMYICAICYSAKWWIGYILVSFRDEPEFQRSQFPCYPYSSSLHVMTRSCRSFRSILTCNILNRTKLHASAELIFVFQAGATDSIWIFFFSLNFDTFEICKCIASEHRKNRENMFKQILT